jgi:PAS domain S-box-containing protein
LKRADLNYFKKILFLLLVQHSLLYSQLEVKNYFNLTGKKDVPVNVIAQDHNGYLLLGTKAGLFKFDGKTTLEIERESPVLKQEISALFVDSKETIWIGTKSGKVYLIKKSKLDSIDFNSQANVEKITSFCELDKGICFGTYGNGLYFYSLKTLKHFTTKEGLSDNVIYRIVCDSKGSMWVGTDAGITQIEKMPGSPLFSIISDKTGLPDNIVRDIQLHENKLLISMQDSGICHYNQISNKIERIPFFTNWTKGPIANAFNPYKGKIIVGSEKSDLLVIDGSFHVYNYQNYIHSNSINQLFLDREKQMWCASQKGISQFVERRHYSINKSKGLSDDKILALAMDNDHTFWIGTTNGVSKIMRNDSGDIKIEKLKDLDKFTISCATKAPNGNIWFGTYGNGIIILGSETKNKIIINAKQNHISNDNISGIYFASQNTVYISTLGGGLVKAKINLNDTTKTIEVEKIYTQADGLGSDYVYSVILDNAGKLFVGSDGGGLQMMENGKFVNLTEKYKMKSNNVFSICKDVHNHIWASSNSDGIIMYDGKSIKEMNLRNGLRDEQPQQLLAVGNNIFSVHSKGIDNINCIEHSVNYYDLNEVDIEPNLNALFFADRTLYIGTNSGIVSFRIGSEKNDSIKPVVFIKSLSVNFKSIDPDSAFEFKYNQNNMSMQFDGIWLKNPGKLLFRYRLNGLEETWQFANEGKTINYNNLAPGNYDFIVQVKNDEGIWSDPTGYSFIINTPIWKRWWFWFILIFIICLTVYSLVQYRLKALQKENVLLEQKVKERTFEIEKQAGIIELKNIELERLSLVASKTDNVVLILDPDGKLEYINESFVKMNNLTMDQLTATYGDTIYELSNNPNITKIIEEAVSNKRSVNYESLNKQLGEGKEWWASSTLTPIFDEAGKLKKIIIIDTDISVRKKQEQIIFQKNKDITDSIFYARKIQQAILPNTSLIKSHLPESFVLYMTKDIVSGDFYWFTHFDNFSIIAAVDCTGHGVPGAFMSLIGYNILNKIVNEQKITDPKRILFELNEGVLAALYKNESESKDGMDIAICKIYHQHNSLEYAGAMRPLWIVSADGILTEIKADKIPIGTKQKDRNTSIEYTNHVIETNKGDTFYIFTDGYADQFGGSKGKKYSTGKLKELLIANSMHDVTYQEQKLKEEHLEWKKENEQVDDILIIGFKL